MEWLETHRLFSQMTAVTLAALAAVLVWRGNVLLFRGLRHPDQPDQSDWVVRGLRRQIVAIGLISLAGGLWWAVAWPFLFAAVFLGEELFETGIMLAALHDQRKAVSREARERPPKRLA